MANLGNHDDLAERYAELERDHRQLTDDHVRLEREHHRLQAEYRRVCEELDWRDEKIRGLYRVIDVLA